MKEAASRARRAMGFASGMLLGFIAAFVLFDLALLQGGTTARVIGLARYFGWHLFHSS